MKHYSQFISDLFERGMSNDELQDLIDRARSAVENVIDDDEKSGEEKKRAAEVLDWIADVEKTFKDENKLHPNSVNGLMRVIAGVGSGRYGRSKSPDGRVPKDYSR